MARLTRLPDWPQRLDIFLAENATRKFAWGEWDCCLAACDAVQAITGKDPARPFRGKYNSKFGALRALSDYVDRVDHMGGLINAVAERIAKAHRAREVKPSQAKRGDVVIVPAPEGDALAVVDGSGAFAVTAGREGLVRVNFTEIKRAWEVA